MIDAIRESDRFLTLGIDITIANEVEDELLAPLRSADVDASIPPQGSGIPVTEYMGYIELVKDTVTVAALVAKYIIAWRRKARQDGKVTNVRIERPGKAPLLLTMATDNEIELYITEGRIDIRTKEKAK
jgi:hypothetical protein